MSGNKNNSSCRTLDPHIVGCIRLARALELRPRAYKKFVREVESSAEFEMLHPFLHITQIDRDSHTGKKWPEQGQVIPVAWFEQHSVFHFTSEAFSRIYHIDKDYPVQSATSQITGVLMRLRVINSRNQLTSALLHVLGSAQKEFLDTGDSLLRRKQSLADVASVINSETHCPVIADSSRLSRLMRHLSFGMGNGKVISAKTLCPSPKDLHRGYVDEIIRMERIQTMQRSDVGIFSDESICRAVHDRFGAVLSRRTVANIRHELGISNSRKRGRNSGYMGIAHGFTPLQPLLRQVVQVTAPPVSGVYELHVRHSPPGPDRVIYIGSAGDLRKRLMDHLRCAGTNSCLANHVSSNRVWFRHRPVAQHWRDLERDIYHAFKNSFGDQPVCNRMSP